MVSKTDQEELDIAREHMKRIENIENLTHDQYKLMLAVNNILSTIKGE